MEVTLSAEAEAMVRRQIEKGTFGSPDEGVAHALFQLELEDAPQELWDALRAEVAEGVADLEAGRFVPGDEAFYDRLRDNSRRRAS